MIRRLRAMIARKSDVQSEIDRSLQGVAYDIEQLKRWAIYINQNHEHRHTKNKARITITKKETEKLQLIISDLQKENHDLKKSMHEMVEYLYEAHSKLQDTEDRLSTVEKDIQGHSRTPKRTSEGHPGTSERTTKDTKKDTREEEIKVIDKTALSASQKELLDLLYREAEPLDYKRIAHLLRKKEKSIRNLIYEVREKGVDIKDTHIGFRKKGFYIEQAEKLRISGR